MRIVAVAMALIVLPFAVPGIAAAEYDDCANKLTANKPCQKVDLNQAGRNSIYYIWAAGAECALKPNSDCRGEGDSEGTLPAGGFWGFVYEETNRYPGLQRFDLRLPDGSVYPADKMVLF